MPSLCASKPCGGFARNQRICKHGNELTGKLLVNCACYVLGLFGEESHLRRYGEKIPDRGGKECQETRGGGGSEKALGAVALPIGHGGGLRTAVQCEPVRVRDSLRAPRGTEG